MVCLIGTKIQLCNLIEIRKFEYRLLCIALSELFKGINDHLKGGQLKIHLN